MKRQLVSKINQHPGLKKKLLGIYHFVYGLLPFIVGTLIRYPAYFRHVLNSKVIAKPGTLSFGGVFNPGALITNENKILLLANGQVLPWFKACGKNRKFYLDGSPVSFLLNQKTLETEDSFVVSDLKDFPNTDDFAIEDFRLFEWKKKKMVNHSWIVKGQTADRIDQTIVKSALSVFDENNKSLQFLGFPKVDFETRDTEKNWVYKEQDNQLILFYSVNPYRVLKLTEKTNFEFHTVINQSLQNKLKDPGGFGSLVSFSTNPIEFDDRHLLVITHQFKIRITGRWYVHWAALIDKKTLLPVQITSKPIFTGAGARGRVPGYRYISSILKVNDEILFFAGEGDVYVTVTKKPIGKLKKLFVEL